MNNESPYFLEKNEWWANSYIEEYEEACKKEKIEAEKKEVKLKDK